MKKIIFVVVAAGLVIAASASARPPYNFRADWVSADKRSTWGVALGDFNGDGWQYVPSEWKDGDGQKHVFYLDHWPALSIREIKINGQVVPRSDYCFDAHAGWYSLKDAPAPAALISVAYTWSNRLDLFAANEIRLETDGRDVVYANADGRLSRFAEWLSETEDYSGEAAAADFDADGDVDVAVLGDELVKVYRNTGAGLEATPSWSKYMPGSAPTGLAWGDVDNDGYLELAVADLWLDQFYIFKNTAGTLEDAPSWSIDYLNAYDVAWGDFDADGDMDLAGGTFAGSQTQEGYVFIFRNNGGVLEQTHCWRSEDNPGRCHALAWGDANADGWLDLVKGICGLGAGCVDRYADLYFSDHGVLPDTPDWESEVYTHNRNSCFVDADGDGLLDLIQDSGSGVLGYFWKGGKIPARPQWHYAPGPPFSIHDIDVGDINGDGWPDVAVACTTSSGYPYGATNKVFLNKVNIGIDVKGFAATPCDRGVALRWEVGEAFAGFNLFREVGGVPTTSEPAKINAELITGESPYRYLDEVVDAGNTYHYWLEVVPLAGAAERHGPVECTAGVKAAFALSQNYPNPARDNTTVAFSVPTAGEATVTIYDISGRKVAVPFAGVAKAGDNEVSVDVSTLAPGVYTYRLEAGGNTAARKLVVVE
ncbi:MAG: T9SS type A sorting domain-containing protein [Candidatus Zixiibacteriota bacterium]|jgi:hypothetical protein